MADPNPVAAARHASSWSIVWGVLLILCGMLAIALPFYAALAVEILVGWLLIFAGVLHVIIAFHTHTAGSVIWRLLIGLAYGFVGAYILWRPIVGVTALTLVVAVLFLLEAVLEIILFFQLRPMHGAGWVLFDGIITLLLGLLIYLHWPSSTLWAIGILVGVSMIFSGVTRIALSSAARAALAHAT
jgi:uncharacterized membrane protein HdeD (DUF308 family)